MSSRNIANYTTFDDILTKNIMIQNAGVGLIMYESDPANPKFSFDVSTGTFTMSGSLNVSGDASFETVIVSEFAGGMQALGSANPADIMDLGFNCNYNDGDSKYTGIIRDASDSLKRWTFFKEITTQPTTTVSGIDSTKLDSVRMNYLYVNNGTATTPSITFHNDTDADTGFYLAAENEIGVTAGGKKIVGINYISGSSTEFVLDSTTSLKLQKINTIDDAASVTMPSISTGHVYLKSETASDKWFKFYSYTNAATPSYSGVVFTSPTTNYFTVNTGSNLEIVRNTTITSDTSSPDYRDATTSQILIIGSASIETKNKFLVPLGSLAAPSIAFAQEAATGIFRSGTNAIGLVANSINMLNVTTSGITSTQSIVGVTGTASVPSYSFTTNPATGFYRDNSATYENVSFTANGTSLGAFWLRTTPQWITGSSGSAAIPSIAWSNDIATGFYSPTNEAASGQLSISINTSEIARFRGRSGTGNGYIDLYNALSVSPDGTNKRALITDTNTTIGNTFKARESWFQAYNLVNVSQVLLYTFRSSGAVTKDYSGNDYNAIAAGAPTISSIVQDTNSVVKRDVLNLTSNTTKYFNLSSHLSAFTSLSDISISFWFKISGALTEDNTLFCCYKPTGTKEITIKILSDVNAFPNAIQVTVQSDALTTYQYHTATSADSGSPSPISVKDGVWHHVVVQLGSGGGKKFMYYDGVALTTASNTIYVTSNGTNTLNPEASTNSLNNLTFSYVSLGAFYNGGAGSLYYTGYLKDFYVVANIVTSAQVTTLYSEPSVYTYAIDAAVINTSKLNAESMSFISGSAAAPSVSFTADLTSGLYLSAAGVLGIATAGVERATISDTIFQYNSNDFEINSTNRWLQLAMSSSTLGPRMVFSHTSTPMRHSIRTNHSSGTASSNWFDFYIADTGALDADGLGNNLTMRLGVTASGASNSLLSLYGKVNAGDGTVALPAYAFLNSTGLGLYRIANNDMGFSANGVLRLEVNTVITVGNAFDDATTRLYVPLGSVSLPGYSFIGDVNSGVYSSAADNVDIACGGVQVVNFNTSNVVSKLPIAINYTSASALSISQTGGAASSTVFTADTTNARIGFGYNALYLSKTDAYNSSTYQRLLLDAVSALTQATGLQILNTSSASTDLAVSLLSLGKASATRNMINIGFYYVADGSTSNKLQFGFNGVSNDQFNIKADGSTNITGTFTVSSTSTFSDQIIAKVGSVSSPSYTFLGDLTTGMYSGGANIIAFTAGSAQVFEMAADHITALQQMRVVSGTVTIPGLAFNSDQDVGLYYISANRFGISNGNQNTWIFDNRSNAPHECLNEIYFKPDGATLRLYVQDKKLRASSNQTVLNVLPILHYKFATNPSTNTAIQDESINKYVIEATTASYVTSTISLTDSNGTGLLQYGAAQFTTTGTDRIETNSLVAELLYLNNFKISIKFKATSIAAGSLFEIYGNRDASTSTNYIKASVSSGNLVLAIHNGTSTIINAATTSVPFTTNIWYNLVLNFDTTGNTFTSNGTGLTLSYSTGTSDVDVTPSTLFTSTANLTAIVGGTSASILAYIAEFYIAPTSTTETVSSLYRTQAHEIYTNKLQIATTSQGIVDEGYILRSDKGNNAIWDNSLQINSGYVQLNSSKVLRLPNGTVSLPAYSYTNDPASGMYLIGAANVGLATNGQKRIDVSDTATSITNDLQLSTGFKRSVTTIATTSATLSASHNVVLCSYAADATNVTITLPSAASHIGREYIIQKTGNGGGSVIINTASGTEYIDDAVTTSITSITAQFERVVLICVESNRWITV